MDRRQFLTRAAAGMLTASGAWRFGGTTVWGQIPWEEEPEAILAGETDAFELGGMFPLGRGIKNEYPVIALDGAGKLWAAWIGEDDAKGEQVYLTSFDGESWGEELQLSESAGFATHPALVRWNDGLAVVWSERHGADDWRILLRRMEGGATGPIVTISRTGGIQWRPAAAPAGDGSLMLAWERKDAGHFDVHAARVESDVKGGAKVEDYGKVDFHQDRDALRPALATAPDGQVWLAYDQADAPGGANVYLQVLKKPVYVGDRVVTEGTGPIRITNHPAADIAPAIAADSRGRVWVAWHSNRRSADQWDIPRWIYLRCYEPGSGRVLEPVGARAGLNLEKEGTVQSLELARLAVAPNGSVLVTGRPSHNFNFQWYDSNGWSELYRLPVDGWGGRGRHLQALFDDAGALWVARRDINQNVVQKITGLPAAGGEPTLKDADELREPAPGLANIQRAPLRWPALEDLEGVDEPLNIYYGDIHGHTWMSDGVGDVDEYYFTRRDYYEDDFASLTDHDTFVGNTILPSEWELMKAMTAHFHEDGRFVTLFGQEYTTARYPRGIGHKCIYTLDAEIPLFDHLDEAYDTSDKLNAACREWKALVFPHHVAWTGTDWENADPEVQTLAEIVSNHGRFEYMGNEPIPHRGGMAGHFIQDALAQGLKFGLIGGSDSHGLIWHHRMAYKRDCNRTGLACVLATELTREAIFEAMRKRRTFASTGIKPRLDFRVNNHLMGEEIQVAEPSVTISVDVTARHDLKWLTVVKNNEVLFQYGGEGFRSRFTITDEALAPGESYYYLRVEFESGDMAWSSPIWVDYRPN